jgi:hypothetical protein
MDLSAKKIIAISPFEEKEIFYRTLKKMGWCRKPRL